MRNSRIKQKLKSKSGFTLVEMMSAVLIMLLASGLILGCIQMALRHADESTRNAESQILCGSISNTLRTELTYASHVQSREAYREELIRTGLAEESYTVHTDPAADFVYFDRSYGMGSGCAIVNGGSVAGEEGRIYLYRNYPEEQELALLVNEAAYSNGMDGFTEIRWNPSEERFDVTVEIRLQGADGKVLDHSDFYVYPLNP